jgi:hypothetical protein
MRGRDCGTDAVDRFLKALAVEECVVQIQSERLWPFHAHQNLRVMI